MFYPNDKIVDIIKKNYRLQYLRDCVIAYMIEESLLQVFNTVSL